MHSLAIIQILSGSLSSVLNNEKDITIMKKTKLDKDTVDVDDFDMRVRLSDESDVSKDELNKLLVLEENERFNIILDLSKDYLLF